MLTQHWTGQSKLKYDYNILIAFIKEHVDLCEWSVSGISSFCIGSQAWVPYQFAIVVWSRNTAQERRGPPLGICILASSEKPTIVTMPA